MADISKYLTAIMEAVYGEEVRTSIHDAIDAINKECQAGLSTAGTYVTQAKGHADAAKTSATNASTYANQSKGYRDQAKEYADQASLLVSPYPVGSIYISVNSTNPSTIFSNTTWERITDAFLFANGSDSSGYFALKADSTVTANSIKVYMWKRTA